MNGPRRPSEDAEDAEGAAIVQAFLAVLFVFKFATVILVFWHLRTWQTGLFLGATSWYFVPLMAVFFGGPILFAWRLRRARARRRELLRAEWMVDDAERLPSDGAQSRR